jgi:uncharacterized DUF497 family protein
MFASPMAVTCDWQERVNSRDFWRRFDMKPTRGPPVGTHFTVGSPTLPALLKALGIAFSPAGGSHAQAILFAPEKDKSNIEKHGVSLERTRELDFMNERVHTDERHQDYGERRFVLYGRLSGKLYACAFTLRGDRIHVISLHRSSDKAARKFGLPERSI